MPYCCLLGFSSAFLGTTSQQAPACSSASSSLGLSSQSFPFQLATPHGQLVAAKKRTSELISEVDML